MAELNKTAQDAALAALFVNNTSGDIEADEVLARFRDILDSYGNMTALTQGQIPQRSATAGVWEVFDFQTGVENIANNRIGRGVTETEFQLDATTTMTDGAVGPGRKFVFTGTSIHAFNLTTASAS